MNDPLKILLGLAVVLFFSRKNHLDCFGRVEFWQLNIFQVLKTSEVREILHRKGKTDFIELFSIAVGEAITSLKKIEEKWREKLREEGVGNPLLNL